MALLDEPAECGIYDTYSEILSFIHDLITTTEMHRNSVMANFKGLPLYLARSLIPNVLEFCHWDSRSNKGLKEFWSLSEYTKASMKPPQRKLFFLMWKLL